MVKTMTKGLGLLMILGALMAMFTMGVSADTTVVSGPFAGCTVGANQVVNCPNGYNVATANVNALYGTPYACVAASSRDDSLPVCGAYGYPYSYAYSPTALTNVVAVYRDNRYCDGIVYITNEGGNLINRCDNGARVYPIYPDYVYYP